MMAVYLKSTTGEGWLVMRDNKPNVFVVKKDGVTNHTIAIDFGALTKYTLNLSNSEYRRVRRECGVPV